MKRGAVLILSLLACSAAPAFAQNSGSPGNSELAGAPGWREAEEQAAKRAAARRQVEDQIAEARARSKKQAEQAAAARSAGARKSEQDRLARQAEQADSSRRSRAKAEDLKTRDLSRRSPAKAEAQLAAREQELAAEEDRLAQQRAEAGDAGDRQETADASAGPGTPLLDGPLPDGPLLNGPPLESAAPDWRGLNRRALDGGPPLRLHASIRSCAFAGEDKALARDYVSARYVRPPRFFERSAYGGAWELRGVMRVEDWRGYLITDTVCELDNDGRVQRFAFLR